MPGISAEFEYYADVLQVPYDVTSSYLKSTYDGIVRYLHPKNGGSSTMFQTISNAYGILLKHLKDNEAPKAIADIEGNEAPEEIEAPISEPFVSLDDNQAATQQDEHAHAEDDALASVEQAPNEANHPAPSRGQRNVQRSGPSHKCPQCSRVFRRKSYWREHQWTHTGEKPFECQDCGKKFTRRSYLNAHQLSHTGENPHACEVCGRSFTHRTQLNQHRRSACGSKKCFKCERCRKAFVSMDSLKQHRSVHENPDLHRCDECGKVVSRVNDLAKHRRSHTGERPYECEVCGEKFAESRSLRKHMARKH